MNVLSLFDGMSVAQIALKELGIIPENYYASEIDKYAIAQTQLNFPNTIQLGSITEWKDWDIDFKSIDLICAGSPCQGFSFAGKQLAFDDPRSKLFFVFIEILNHCKSLNPEVKFLLENVDMKKDHRRVINEMTGVFGQNINSNLVSAQNRSRWYWHNIKTKLDGFFDEVQCDIPQPKDQGILLRDILESEVDEKYYISVKALNRIERKSGFKPQINPDKTGTLNTKNNSGQLSVDNGTTLISDRGPSGSYIFDKSGKTGALSVRNGSSHDNHVIINIEGIPKPNQEKASCFAAGGHSGGNHSDMDLIIIAQRGRGENNEQQLEPNTTGKTNCLTGVQKDNLVLEKFVPKPQPSTSKDGLVLAGNLTGGRWDNTHEQSGRVYSPDGKMQTLATMGGGNQHPKTMQTQRIRRLTPTECARLQTIPDWYDWSGMSDTQRYRCLGNGWTNKIIVHILSYLNSF